MRFALYIRMSTETQEDSPETQRRILLEWAARQNHQVVTEYLDAAISGGKAADRRPQLAALLHDVRQKNRTFDGVLVIRLDRLSRNTIYRVRLIEDLHKHHCALYTPAGEVSLDTAEDRMVQSILASVDQHEREVTGERIREHNQALAMQGKIPCGYMPIGLCYDKTTKIVSMTDRAGEIEQLFTWYVETGGNAGEVARRANAIGMQSQRGNPLSVNAVMHLLRSSAYRQQIQYNGVCYDGSAVIPQILPAGIIAQVDALLGQSLRMASRSRGSKRAYSGRLLCAQCGAHLHSHNKRGTNLVPAHYYGWSCPNRSLGICVSSKISERYLDTLIGRALQRLLSGWQFEEGKPEPRRDTTAQRERLHERRLRWVEMCAAGVITLNVLREKVAAIDEELASIREPRDTTTTELPPVIMEGMTEHLASLWPTFEQSQRRELLASLGAEMTVTSRPDAPRSIVLCVQGQEPVVESLMSGAARYRWQGRARIYSVHRGGE